MWCLYADFKFWIRSSEGTVLSSTLDCNPVFHENVVGVNQMIGIMMGSIAVFGIIYYFVTLLPDGEGGR